MRSKTADDDATNFGRIVWIASDKRDGCFRLSSIVASKERDSRALLLAAGRSRLEQLGVSPTPGQFVCPVCLRLLPEAEARRGHFPADALKGGAAQIELECADCNQASNVAYEKAAQDFLTGEWGIEIRPEGRGAVKLRGDLMVEGDTVSIRLPKLSSRGERELAAAMSHVKDQSSLHLRVHQPTKEALHRALLAWSFLAWSKYAGYLYMASPGAAIVRRLVLDVTQALPRTVVLQGDGLGPLSPPLPRPEPVVLVATVRSEIWSVLGLGMAWGPAVVALPFANDKEATVYERLEETSLLKPSWELHTVSIPDRLRAVQPGELRRAVRLTELATGHDHDVTRHLSGQEAADLAAGLSPYGYAPRIGRRPTK
jgi:hypothetical protein